MRLKILFALASFTLTLLTSLSEAVLEIRVLGLLPVGHLTIDIIYQLAIVSEHVSEFVLIVAGHTLLLEVIELLLSGLESIVSDFLAFLFNGFQAKCTFFNDLFLNLLLLAVFSPLDILKFLLIVLVLSVFLVRNAFHDVAELIMLGPSTRKCLLECTILGILLVLKCVIDLSHLGTQISHHCSLLIGSQVTILESRLEAAKDLVLQLIVLV